MVHPALGLLDDVADVDALGVHRHARVAAVADDGELRRVGRDVLEQLGQARGAGALVAGADVRRVQPHEVAHRDRLRQPPPVGEELLVGLLRHQRRLHDLVELEAALVLVVVVRPQAAGAAPGGVEGAGLGRAGEPLQGGPDLVVRLAALDEQASERALLAGAELDAVLGREDGVEQGAHGHELADLELVAVLGEQRVEQLHAGAAAAEGLGDVREHAQQRGVEGVEPAHLLGADVRLQGLHRVAVLGHHPVHGVAPLLLAPLLAAQHPTLADLVQIGVLEEQRGLEAVLDEAEVLAEAALAHVLGAGLGDVCLHRERHEERQRARGLAIVVHQRGQVVDLGGVVRLLLAANPDDQLVDEPADGLVALRLGVARDGVEAGVGGQPHGLGVGRQGVLPVVPPLKQLSGELQTPLQRAGPLAVEEGDARDDPVRLQALDELGLAAHPLRVLVDEPEDALVVRQLDGRRAVGQGGLVALVQGAE